jgi:hypothetical protein
MGIILGLTLLVSIFENISFADESEDIAKQLAEHHKNQAQSYEQEARVLARAGNFQESADKYVLSAEQYRESAAYYLKLNDYWNAAEYDGRASFAHKEAAVIHSILNDFSGSLLHYLLSDKFNAHSLQNKGMAMFGDAYLLPPRFQVHFVDDPHEIVCKKGLELIFKMNDSPACVSSSSKVKLIDRGWAK